MLRAAWRPHAEVFWDGGGPGRVAVDHFRRFFSSVSPRQATSDNRSRCPFDRPLILPVSRCTADYDVVVLRPLAMCSATRQALAMIVSVGFMPVPVGKGP